MIKSLFEIKDNPLQKLKAFAASALLTFLIFAVLPFSQIGLKKESKEYISVSLSSAQRHAAANESAQNSSVQNFNTLNTNALSENSAKEIKKFSLSLDSNYGNFTSGTYSVSGVFELEVFNNIGSELGANFALQTFNLEELDRLPQLLNSAKPEYPASLLKRGIEGEVRLSLFINPDGSVELDKIIFSTNKLFEEAALKILENLRYEAPLKNSEKVRANFILPIPFKILK